MTTTDNSIVKVLILAYDFPPYVSVGGLRPYSWYKFLHLYNVYPIVVTRQWENKFGNSLDYIAPGYSNSIDREEAPHGTLIRAPFKPNVANHILLKHGAHKFRILRKLISAYYEFFQFVLPIGNKRSLHKAADEFLKDNPVDCIVATGDPFVLFKYASALSEKYSIPWIADYRDPWVQDKSMKSSAYKKWSAYFEREILKSAERITTVAPFFKKQIEQNVSGKKFEILYNGYDPDIITAVSGIEQCGEELSIAFAGTIYDWHPIESFLGVCNELIRESEGFKLQLHFYGINKEEEVRVLLDERYQLLEQSTHFYPKRSNLELARAISKQNVCLLFNDYSIIGTKIFDYLAVKRQIILCYENDSDANELKKKFYQVDENQTESSRAQAEVIETTRSGFVAKDAGHLKKILQELHDELRDCGSIRCSSVGVEEYSRVKQVEKLASIVRDLHHSKRNH